MVFDFQGYHTDFTTNPLHPLKTNSCNLTIPGETSTQTTSFWGVPNVTIPETNVSPENGWLEYYFPFGMAYFQVPCLFWGVYFWGGVDCPPLFSHWGFCSPLSNKNIHCQYKTLFSTIIFPKRLVENFGLEFLTPKNRPPVRGFATQEVTVRRVKLQMATFVDLAVESHRGFPPPRKGKKNRWATFKTMIWATKRTLGCV